MGIIKSVIIITLLGLAFIAGFMANGFLTNLSSAITGKATTNIPESYALTKAYCNSNECVDLEITCENDKVTGIALSSGVVQLPENWTDPRTQEEIKKLCEKNQE